MSKTKNLNMSGKDAMRTFLGVVRNDQDVLKSMLNKYAPDMMGSSRSTSGNRTVRKPPKGYRAGIDPEFDYFNPPKMARSMNKGGLVKKDRRDGLAQKGRTKGAIR